MPTGYTAEIAEGISFEKFTLNCARAFGALISMRDDSKDAPIPILTKGLKWFLKGWIGNIDEVYRWKKFKSDKMCPIYFSLFGLVNIMPNAKPVKGYDFDIAWIKEHFKELPFEVDIGAGWSNFGYIRSSASPVLIDYAIGRTSTEHTDDCTGDCKIYGCKKN